MKKNLRIVSAAAAALLAVAPVAAAAVVSPANAEVTSSKMGDTVKANANAIWGYTYNASTKTVTPIPANADGTGHFNFPKGFKFQAAGNVVTDKRGLKFVPVYYGAANNVIYVNAKQVDSIADNSGKVNNDLLSIKKLNSELRAVHESDGSVHYLPTNTLLKVVGPKDNGTEIQVVDENGKVKGTYIVNTDALKKALAVPTKAKDETPSTTINAPSTTIFDADGNVDPAISAVAASDGNTSALVGQVNVSLHGQNYVALLHGSANTRVYRYAGKKSFHAVSDAEAKHLHAGVQYYARLNDVTVNLGNSEAGKTEKFTLTKGWFEKGNAGTYSDRANSAYYRTVSVTVDKDGIAHLGNIFVPFNAYDANNMQEVHIYARKTGNVVTSGSIDLHAVNGQLNVEAVRRAINHEYVGRQVDGGVEQQPVYFLNNLRDQLNKANIKVDPNTGYFKAPSTFTVNVTYKSVINGAEATIPVTVNVDNAAAQTPANEQTTTKTIMHIATIYDKNGKATNEPVLRAYNSVSVVSTPVELKDASGKSLGKFYKLAGKDEYIKVGNIDGTSRSLKHNSYVYKANGKAIKVSKKHHRVLKSGSSVTTYGKSFKNDVLGTQVYRIGRNQYVKVANFR